MPTPRLSVAKPKHCATGARLIALRAVRSLWRKCCGMGFWGAAPSPARAFALDPFRCGEGGLGLALNPSPAPLALASSPFGLFARFSVDAAAWGFGALPQAPQGLSPLTLFAAAGILGQRKAPQANACGAFFMLALCPRYLVSVGHLALANAYAVLMAVWWPLSTLPFTWV